MPANHPAGAPAPSPWEAPVRRFLVRWGWAFLATPALVYLLAVFGGGFVKLFLASIGLLKGRLDLSIYQELFTSHYFLEALWRTFRLAVITTLVSLAIGYPVAYFISRSPPDRRNRYLMIILLPWLTSIAVRSFGWRILLSDKGLVNAVLLGLGLRSEPLQMVHNEIGIVVGLVHVLSPYMILSLLTLFMSLSKTLEEAAAMLGAGPAQTFRRVILPLTLPGMVTGSMVVFLLSLAVVVTPQLLGGIKERTVAMIMYDQMLKLYDFERGATIAFILVLVSVPATLLLQVLERRTRWR